MSVAFAQVMLGLVGIACGAAVLIEPSFADRVRGWRGPRWFGSCVLAAGAVFVLAGFSDVMVPGVVHGAALGGAVFAAAAAVLIGRFGGAVPTGGIDERGGTGAAGREVAAGGPIEAGAQPQPGTRDRPAGR
jgi:hypothetical protein